MREKIIKLYQYDELSDKAKARAVDAERLHAADDDWWYESVFDDAVEVAALMGIEIEQRAVKFRDAVVGHKPCIFFSGFSSQGDGACFEGRYQYKKGSVKAVVEYAPKDKELDRIVRELYTLQKEHGYGITATVKHEGHYSHKYCTAIDVYNKDGDYADLNTGNAVAEILRDFMEWIYRQLKTEYEYRTGDEAVIEDIRANEMEFTEEGVRDHG
jgi:hypothetical protein